MKKGQEQEANMLIMKTHTVSLYMLWRINYGLCCHSKTESTNCFGWLVGFMLKYDRVYAEHLRQLLETKVWLHISICY